ncbi:sugar O-acetyltransferase [Plantactinospora sp. B5E13]|uniref:sugar O-acetyltransferase n=1 Tax=unclassified Plantactinospora TaxID=2631981 RepID=UPI00325F76F0
MDGEPDTRTARERMLTGDLYRADDPELVALALRADRLVRAYNSVGADEPERRDTLLRELLGDLGTGVTVRPPFHCDYGTQIRIGDRSYLNFNTVLLDVAAITIGADVQIGPNVQLLTAYHPVEAEPRRAKWEAARPIVLGDNVWLGGGVIVLGGVTIGPDTVVGAGSVVTRDLPAGVVAVGNPARVVRPITPTTDPST